MKVERWCVVSRMEYGFQPPDIGKHCLQGFVHGHQFHTDGKGVTTSRMVGRNGNRVVTKSGSEYELGEPDPAYEAQYPNAKERLLASLPSSADGTAPAVHHEAGTLTMAALI